MHINIEEARNGLLNKSATVPDALRIAWYLAVSFPGICVKTRARSTPAQPVAREIRELATLRHPYF